MNEPVVPGGKLGGVWQAETAFQKKKLFFGI
jgi:hypothetical protein